MAGFISVGLFSIYELARGYTLISLTVLFVEMIEESIPSSQQTFGGTVLFRVNQYTKYIIPRNAIAIKAIKMYSTKFSVILALICDF